jgi:hypothetical protein
MTANLKNSIRRYSERNSTGAQAAGGNMCKERIMTDLIREEKEEVARIRQALLPLGYWVYGVTKPAMGGSHADIHVRIPEDDADWDRLNAAQQLSLLSEQPA